MNRILQIAFVCLLTLVSLKFFDAKFINASIVNYAQYACILGAVVLSVPYILPKNRGFVFPVQLLLFSFLVSILMAFQYWDQSLKDGVFATIPYLLVFFFFFLLRVKFPVNLLEKIIVGFGVLYILLYAFQYFNSGTIYFGQSLWGDEFTENRGTVRIIFPGGGIFILSTFIALNKLTSQKKHRWFWGLLAFFGLLLPVLQVTRQFIIGIFLIFLYHGARTFSATNKMLLVAAFFLLLFVVPFIDSPIIQGLIESTKDDASAGSEYIRVLAGEYFLFDFSPSTATAIFGNGVPYTGVSNYGFFLDMLGIEQYYFLSDVGIIAVYAMFGIPALIGFLLIWMKSFTIPLPKEFQYLKYYLWLILLTSLTWYSTYHHHYLITTVFVLYMYQSVHENERSSISAGDKG